jgi:hypothetical protein
LLTSIWSNGIDHGSRWASARKSVVTGAFTVISS